MLPVYLAIALFLLVWLVNAPHRRERRRERRRRELLALRRMREMLNDRPDP